MDEVKEWKDKSCPIKRFQRYIESRGLWDEVRMGSLSIIIVLYRNPILMLENPSIIYIFRYLYMLLLYSRITSEFALTCILNDH